MGTEVTECPSFNATEIRFILEGFFLLHHHGNIDTLEQQRLNLGYPVLMLAWSAIEFVASLCSSKDSADDYIHDYFNTYMGRVDPRYLETISNDGLLVPSRDGNGKVKTHQEKGEANAGDLLRTAMRNRLTHSCGSILEIDSRKETENLHLMIRALPSGYTLFIHTYKLYHDYRSSLDFVYCNLESDEFREMFISNLGRERARMLLMNDSVDKILQKYAEKNRLSPSHNRLVFQNELYVELDNLGKYYTKNK